jgi:hypothetical protein
MVMLKASSAGALGSTTCPLIYFLSGSIDATALALYGFPEKAVQNKPTGVRSSSAQSGGNATENPGTEASAISQICRAASSAT